MPQSLNITSLSGGHSFLEDEEIKSSVLLSPGSLPSIDNESLPETPNPVLSPLSQPESAQHLLETRTQEPTLPQLPAHLTPSSAERYHLLRERTNAPFELFEGLLVDPPEMADEQHRRVQKFWIYLFQTVHRKKGIKLLVYSEVELDIADLRAALRRVRDQERAWLAQQVHNCSSSSSESDCSAYVPTSKHKLATIRLPDVAVGPYFSSRAPQSPRSKKKVFHNSRMPTVVIEVTSPSTRHTDLYFKWVEYARCGIDEYIIVDRTKKCIIRGYFHSEGKQVPNGDPEYEVSDQRECKARSRSSVRYYYREIYKADDILKAKFLDELSDKDLLKVSRLLDPERAEDALANDERKNKVEIDRRDEKIRELELESSNTVKSRDEEIEVLRRELSRYKQKRHNSSVDAKPSARPSHAATTSKVLSPSRSASTPKPPSPSRSKSPTIAPVKKRSRK